MNEDQFRSTYKKAVDSMNPSEETKKGLLAKMEQHQETKRPRKTIYIAASIVLAAGIGLASPTIWNQINGPASPAQVAQVDPGTSGTGGAASAGSVVIPKLKLPDSSSGVKASMIALVVYKGNIYTQSATSIEAADAAALRGDRLGRTTGGIDEWSGKEEYTELSSNIGETDIYTVKGYDSGFLIMSYSEIDGQVFAELYEHTNGITVNSGDDLIGMLNLEGRIASAQWESFDSWNNGLQQYSPLSGSEALDGFLSALLAAKPLAAEPLIAQGIYDSEDRKVIYLELQDKTQVQLVLFGQGLVRYGDAPVFFEVESGAFQTLWNSMEQ
ncbi:hypothetical protein [Paenibacillus tianjinensis]|uniref:DUF4340 domain-containing protein n=1 Tax=Paenibacillus tianjinensis TaxID=2810347 RepID=A0ABX7L768_9BACL|nr:hypothetical protein [Paenibacillus tianjinensis]QSF43822.1 hypothetical protein JRJ22_21590 [Paenibacillus tianjinensis]